LRLLVSLQRPEHTLSVVFFFPPGSSTGDSLIRPTHEPARSADDGVSQSDAETTSSVCICARAAATTSKSLRKSCVYVVYSIAARRVCCEHIRQRSKSLVTRERAAWRGAAAVRPSVRPALLTFHSNLHSC
jgi:hypothetical protein